MTESLTYSNNAAVHVGLIVVILLDHASTNFQLKIESKAPVSQLVNAEVNSVVVIAVLAPNYTLQVRTCECHA